MAPSGGVADREVTRTTVVHCPDWPVAVAGVDPEEPAAVFRANRVVAASQGARTLGITLGLRRREAQRRCPHLTVLGHDPVADAGVFEAVAACFEAVTPRVEVTVPGTLAFATRGPSRYFGGDQGLSDRAAHLLEDLARRWRGEGRVLGPVAVGTADGSFGALLAARRAHLDARTHRTGIDRPLGDGSRPDGEVPSLVVPPGESARFLASLPVAALGQAGCRPDLIDLWKRLGLRTLGQLAEISGPDMVARFGHEGQVAHRLASGLDPYPLDARRPPVDLAVVTELDPPVEQVDRAAFAAKALADRLHAGLAARGVVCTQVVVTAETEHGESLSRCWRHEGSLDAVALAERVRWQLEGWLSGSASAQPTAGITRLGLEPVEVVAARGRQLGFWGGETLVDERVVRSVARIQGILGIDAVTVPEVRGGRGPADRVTRVPVMEVDLTALRPAARLDSVTEPWPGRVPDPAPATVAVGPEPVELVDAEGCSVMVSGRLEVSAPPVQLTFESQVHPVVAWTGPWPVDERWWDPLRRRRRARFQVQVDSGSVFLVTLESGRWSWEATYD